MSIDWDDLVIGPCVAAFGDPITYISAIGGNLLGITGVFDEQYLDLNAIGNGAVEQMGAPGNISTTRPVLGVQLSQFPALTPPMQGDGLTPINGTAYIVREVRPDGHGHALLLLNEA